MVGVGYGRQVKTLKDYALGGKNFSTATIAATCASGSGFFIDIENTYSSGLYYLIACLGLPLGLLLSGQLALRMREFLDNVSISEAMGGLYGKKVRIITAICGTLSKTGFVAVQFKVISRILMIIFNLEGSGASFAAATIVILYSAFGGIKAVTFTDVVQFFTFGTIIPVIALVIWNNLQSSTQVVDTLANNPIFNIKEVVGFTPKLRPLHG